MKIYTEIISRFKSLPDKRLSGRLKFKLYEVLFIVLIATVAGYKGWKMIHNFAVMRKTWFQNYLPNLKRIPSPDTIRRAISNHTDPEAFNAIFIEFFPKLVNRSLDRAPGRPKTNGVGPVAIHLDGKNVNSISHYFKDLTKFYILNAFCLGVLILQKIVGDKTNEITVVPQVLKELNKAGHLKGKLITMDAMGCQKQITQLIDDYQAYYLLGLKGNQSSTFDEVKTLFEVGLPNYPKEFKSYSYQREPICGHGRIDEYTITVVYLSECDAIAEWFPSAKDWPGLATVIKVRRVSYNEKTQETSDESRYFLSSAALKPEIMLENVRGHWEVETHHYVLDVTLEEDKTRIRSGNAPIILSGMRKLAINLIKPLVDKWEKESHPDIIDLIRGSDEFRDDVLKKKIKEIEHPKLYRIRIGNQGNPRNQRKRGQAMDMPKMTG